MRQYFKSISLAQWLIIMDETLFRMLDILLQGAVSQNFFVLSKLSLVNCGRHAKQCKKLS